MIRKYPDDDEEEIIKLIPGPATDPRHTNTRFSFLFLACFICIGSYFIYDNPAALESQILEVIPT